MKNKKRLNQYYLTEQRARIINYLLAELTHQFENYSIAELARSTQTCVNTVFKTLDILQESGVIDMQKPQRGYALLKFPELFDFYQFQKLPRKPLDKFPF